MIPKKDHITLASDKHLLSMHGIDATDDNVHEAGRLAIVVTFIDCTILLEGDSYSEGG